MPLAGICAGQRVTSVPTATLNSTGVYSYREIAKFFGLHLATVGRIIRKQMLQGEN
jgi:putative transposase